MKSIVEEALNLGATEAKVIGPGDIVTANWVRLKCRFGCPGWGNSITCPPNTPKPDEIRKVVDEYQAAILIRKRGSWPDCMERMVELERFAFLKGYYKAFAFSCGPCRLCDDCNPEKVCPSPEKVRPSMEACGIDVFATARNAGMPIDVAGSRDENPNYYTMILVE